MNQIILVIFLFWFICVYADTICSPLFTFPPDIVQTGRQVTSIAVDEDLGLLALGAPVGVPLEVDSTYTGRVYVYDRKERSFPDGIKYNWTPHTPAFIEPPNGATTKEQSYRFGNTVVIGPSMFGGSANGTGIFVSAAADNEVRETLNSAYRGVVYVFNMDGNLITFHATLTIDDMYEAVGFGYALALSSDGSRVIVSDPLRAVSTRLGVVYVFDYVSDNHEFQLKGSITSNVASGQPQTGYSVALSGDGRYAVVGSPLAQIGDVRSGSAVLLALGDNPSAPVQSALLLPDAYDGQDNIRYGHAVAINKDGSRAFVTSPLISPLGGAGATGCVVIFDVTSVGPVLRTMVFAPVGNSEMGYALDVDDSGTIMLLGAPNRGATGGGFLIYDQSTTDDVWPALEMSPYGQAPRVGEAVALGSSGLVVALSVPLQGVVVLANKTAQSDASCVDDARSPSMGVANSPQQSAPANEPTSLIDGVGPRSPSPSNENIPNTPHNPNNPTNPISPNTPPIPARDSSIISTPSAKSGMIPAMALTPMSIALISVGVCVLVSIALCVVAWKRTVRSKRGRNPSGRRRSWMQSRRASTQMTNSATVLGAHSARHRRSRQIPDSEYSSITGLLTPTPNGQSTSTPYQGMPVPSTATLPDSSHEYGQLSLSASTMDNEYAVITHSGVHDEYATGNIDVHNTGMQSLRESGRRMETV